MYCVKQLRLFRLIVLINIISLNSLSNNGRCVIVIFSLAQLSLNPTPQQGNKVFEISYRQNSRQYFETYFISFCFN